MELEIYWTDFAKKELQEIFKYYKNKAGINVARNLVLGITEAAIQIQRQPLMGQREVLLENQSRIYHYLIHKNYKLIYWINTEQNSIEIFDVFDTRQNPIKIKRTK